MLLRHGDRGKVKELIRRTRAAAREIEELNSTFGEYYTDVSLARFRAEQGDRTQLANLREAARTLKTYAGFLQLVASAAKKETAKSDAQNAEPAAN